MIVNKHIVYVILDGLVVYVLRVGGVILFEKRVANVLEAKSLQSIGVCAETGVVE